MNGEAAAAEENSLNMAKLNYVLYLASIVVGLTSLIGLVIAYVNRADAPDWLKSHYQFQIRTFWIGLLYGFVGLLLSLVLIGWLVLLFTLVWMIIRCVKGLKVLETRSPHPNPKTWMF